MPPRVRGTQSQPEYLSLAVPGLFSRSGTRDRSPDREVQKAGSAHPIYPFRPRHDMGWVLPARDAGGRWDARRGCAERGARASPDRSRRGWGAGGASRRNAVVSDSHISPSPFGSCAAARQLSRRPARAMNSASTRTAPHEEIFLGRTCRPAGRGSAEVFRASRRRVRYLSLTGSSIPVRAVPSRGVDPPRCPRGTGQDRAGLIGYRIPTAEPRPTSSEPTAV
jgi:hypothetical protein